MTSEPTRKSGNEGVKTFYIGFLALGLIIGILLGIAVGSVVLSPAQTQCTLPESTVPNALTPEEAGTTTIDFLREYAIPPGVEISLINVTELENANLYTVAANVSMLGTSETREVYITKDGEILFPGAIDIEEYKAMAELQQEQAETMG
ncbi:MAG: hypothetical protein JW878_00140 [Methanomicrobia archaeon]|nr:hypothetical protein [Methanomicrobia archaeon]